MQIIIFELKILISNPNDPHILEEVFYLVPGMVSISLIKLTEYLSGQTNASACGDVLKLKLHFNPFCAMMIRESKKYFYLLCSVEVKYHTFNAHHEHPM